MLRISISHPLPARPHRLSADELRNVFGGCIAIGSGGCKADLDCCQDGPPNTTIGCSGGTCFSSSNPF